ncbi:MAG TPA: glycosyltransferase [Solirubrobacteraceae bacterium]|jgi:GT2 family glycosyltransferase
MCEQVRGVAVTADDERSSECDPRGVIVICTRDRPVEVGFACTAANAAAPNTPILVVDASSTDATRRACAALADDPHGSRLKLTYHAASRPGLARQRNEAVEICRRMKAEVIHFIDDDTVVSSGYFEAIEERFHGDPHCFGVGGVIVNQPRVTFLGFKRLFLLGSRRRGSVLRSGRVMLGQYPGTSPTDPVEWLSGCSMSYRIGAFDEIAFDDRLEGASIGEDYDFSFRLSRQHALVIEPAATCVHHLTPTARSSRRAHARTRTQLIHRRASEYRALGLSPSAFWWSTLGDFLLRGMHGMLRLDARSLHEALGVAEGAVAVLRTPAPASQQAPPTTAATERLTTQEPIR